MSLCIRLSYKNNQICIEQKMLMFMLVFVFDQGQFPFFIIHHAFINKFNMVKHRIQNIIFYQIKPANHQYPLTSNQYPTPLIQPSVNTQKTSRQHHCSPLPLTTQANHQNKPPKIQLSEKWCQEQRLYSGNEDIKKQIFCKKPLVILQMGFFCILVLLSTQGDDSPEHFLQVVFVLILLRSQILMNEQKRMLMEQIQNNPPGEIDKKDDGSEGYGCNRLDK